MLVNSIDVAKLCNLTLPLEILLKDIKPEYALLLFVRSDFTPLEVRGVIYQKLIVFFVQLRLNCLTKLALVQTT